MQVSSIRFLYTRLRYFFLVGSEINSKDNEGNSVILNFIKEVSWDEMISNQMHTQQIRKSNPFLFAGPVFFSRCGCLKTASLCRGGHEYEE